MNCARVLPCSFPLKILFYPGRNTMKWDRGIQGNSLQLLQPQGFSPALSWARVMVRVRVRSRIRLEQCRQAALCLAGMPSAFPALPQWCVVRGCPQSHSHFPGTPYNGFESLCATSADVKIWQFLPSKAHCDLLLICFVCTVQSALFLLFFPLRAHILPFFLAEWWSQRWHPSNCTRKGCREDVTCRGGLHPPQMMKQSLLAVTRNERLERALLHELHPCHYRQCHCALPWCPISDLLLHL